MQKQLGLLGINSESFKRLGGRLVSLCREHIEKDGKIRIIVAFSDQDSGRGNAILWLTKHFGVFPMEIGEPEGKLDLNDFNDITRDSQPTLLIQSIPLCEGELYDLDGGQKEIPGIIKKSVTEDGLKYHVPITQGLKNSLARASVDMLIQQIGVLSQKLTSKKKVHGLIIYLAGFSFIDETAVNEALPSSKFISWYLMIVDKNCVKRIYRQPELDQFLYNLSADNPYIVDIETMITEMEMDPNYD